MTEPSARVLADSISPAGDRLTTMEVVINRFVLAEFNTHRVFSRNSASSRAIPFPKQLERVNEDLAAPVFWASEQTGMQGGAEILNPARADWLWKKARDVAVQYAQELADLGVHKSLCNRLLEPFLWHTIICTATEWDGFWRQRCSPLAQPEIRAAAEAMRRAYDESTPVELRHGMWHLPLIDPETQWEVERDAQGAGTGSGDTLMDPGSRAAAAIDVAYWDTLKKISAARCARVSYLTHDGKRDWHKDVELYEKLVSAEPAHASPLEHVATPCEGHGYDAHLGNFTGWDQMRHQVLDF